MLLVDDDQPEVARSARTPPSAGRRRRAPRRGAGAATRRGARRRRAPECSTATTSPNRAWKRHSACGVSAISGTSTIARAGRERRLDRAAGRPRSCPSRSPRGAESAAPRALGAGQRRPARPAPRAGRRSAPAAARPRCRRRGAGRGARRGRAQRAPGRAPRAAAAPAVPSSDATVGPPRAQRREQRALARGERGAPSSSARRAGGGQLGDQRPLGARARPRAGRRASATARAPASSSTRAPSTRRARPGRAGRAPAAPHRARPAARARARSRSASSTTTPERSLAPERDAQQRADLTTRCRRREPVVERAAHRAGAGQRLDAGDHRAYPNLDGNQAPEVRRRRAAPSLIVLVDARARRDRLLPRPSIVALADAVLSQGTAGERRGRA